MTVRSADIVCVVTRAFHERQAGVSSTWLRASLLRWRIPSSYSDHQSLPWRRGLLFKISHFRASLPARCRLLEILHVAARASGFRYSSTHRFWVLKASPPHATLPPVQGAPSPICALPPPPRLLVPALTFDRAGCEHARCHGDPEPLHSTKPTCQSMGHPRPRGSHIVMPGFHSADALSPPPPSISKAEWRPPAPVSTLSVGRNTMAALQQHGLGSF